MRANLARAAALTILLCAGQAFAGQDGDGVPDFLDNCIEVENPDQADWGASSGVRGIRTATAATTATTGAEAS